MRDLLAPARMARRGLFEPAEVTRLVDEHVAGRENHAHTLFPLMVFERWADAHLADRGRRAELRLGLEPARSSRTTIAQAAAGTRPRRSAISAATRAASQPSAAAMIAAAASRAPRPG